MNRNLPLRIRVTLLYTAMGIVLSLLFAWAAVYITEDYEQVLVDAILKSEAEDYAARLRVTPDTPLPKTKRLKGYLRLSDGSGAVPAALAHLPPGIHESEVEGDDGLHMGVFDTDAGRLFLTIDLHGIEALEVHLNRILVGVIVIGTLISAWLGWLLAGGVILPIRRLADAVDGLPSKPMQTSVGAGMPRDELGRLGQAIDDYQGRLVAAEAAERSFFADASHELRTPIAVVRGATELLLEDGAELPGLQPRLIRLDRGIRELSDLLDALLRLAKGQFDSPVQVELVPWLGKCLSRNDLVRTGVVQLEIEADGNQWKLPQQEAELIFTGLVRRLLPPTATGLLRVSVSGLEIKMQFIADNTPSEVSPGIQSRPSDRRLGLTLISRLAEQLGWRIDDSLAEEGLVIVHLPGSRA